MRKWMIALAAALLLAGCAGRSEPGGTFLDPVCLPDGSVSLWQMPNLEDQFGQPLARKEYCAWNKGR